MPTWANNALWIVGALIAVGTLLKTVVFPSLKIISRVMPLIESAEKTVPLLVELTKQFQGSSGAFNTLRDISKEFHTDSGTSLRDVINRLEGLLQVLQTNVTAMTITDEQDRARAARLEEQLNVLSAKVGPFDEYRPQLDAIIVRVDALLGLTARVDALEASENPPKEEP